MKNKKITHRQNSSEIESYNRKKALENTEGAITNG